MRGLYVSYDGALDPLGATQVLPYLRGLSSLGVGLDLISFEKPTQWGQEIVANACDMNSRTQGSRGIP